MGLPAVILELLGLPAVHRGIPAADPGLLGMGFLAVPLGLPAFDLRFPAVHLGLPAAGLELPVVHLGRSASDLRHLAVDL